MSAFAFSLETSERLTPEDKLARNVKTKYISLGSVQEKKRVFCWTSPTKNDSNQREKNKQHATSADSNLEKKHCRQL